MVTTLNVSVVKLFYSALEAVQLVSGFDRLLAVMKARVGSSLTQDVW